MYKLICILILSTILSAQETDTLLQLARRTFPGYTVEIREYGYNDLNSMLNLLEQEQPGSRTLKKRMEQAELRIKELKQSYTPQFKLGASQQLTDLRERLVTIYTKVPVEWDNANPEQIDVNLPNGGHGILWMPKPTEYDWRYIDIHASRPYESNSAGLNTGLHYDYHSGISLDLINLNLNKRFSPETYGFDWYSSLDNSISIPLLKILNSSLSPREIEIRSIENSIENLKISARLNQAEERNRLRNLFLKLYLAWEKHFFYRQMIELTREQTAEADVLSDKKHLTVLEKIAVENELQSYLSTENIVYYEILDYSSAIKNDGRRLTIYRPQQIELSEEIHRLEAQSAALLNLQNLDKTVLASPQLCMLENNLKSIKDNLALNSRSSRIQLDLVGRISLFTSSDLGFKSPAEAARMVFTDPDGLNTSIGMQFSMPLSFHDADFQYRIAVKDYQIAAEDLQAAKAGFKKNYHDLRLNLLNLKENLRAAEVNLKYIGNRMQATTEFYNLKRISAFEFNSYRKEKIRSEFALKDAMVSYCNALADFLALLSENPAEAALLK